MKILNYSKLLIAISVLIILSGVYIISVYGFKTSIEYTGGTVFSFNTNKIEDSSSIKNYLKSIGYEASEVSQVNQVLKVKVSETNSDKVVELKSKLQSFNKDLRIEGVETVGSSMGIEFAKNSFLALIFSLLGILLFVTYSFYNLPNNIPSWQFGLATLIAMFHDVLIVISFFSLMGYFYGVEIDSLFLTALLTIIGFSVNDTIVVFDRIRENLIKYANKKSFYEVCNLSIFETLNRSLITSFTVILIMFALYLLGGESIKYFSLALVVGITAGTYSSIFIATPFVLIINKQFKKS
jgi:preprotein translocase subunit SecF